MRKLLSAILILGIAIGVALSFSSASAVVGDLIPDADNTYDVGRFDDARWRRGFFGEYVQVVNGASTCSLVTNEIGCYDGNQRVQFYVEQNGLSVLLDGQGELSVILKDLPSFNPNFPGQLWNDNGTLKISAGP